MKTVAIEQFGGRERLKVLDLSNPRPKAGEVRLRVMAAGVNPVDWKIREGHLRDRIPHEFPVVLGWDASGIIDEVGEDVSGLREGDEVYAYCRKPIIHEGAYAEYVTLPEDCVARKPKTMDFYQAASVPLSCLTAYQCLIEFGSLKKGQTVLIHGASGGVGGFAVQLGCLQGCRVLGTSQTVHHDYLERLGIDTAHDYTKSDFVDAVKSEFPDGIDFVLDTVGDDVTFRSFDVLKSGGKLASIVTPANHRTKDLSEKKSVSYRYVFVRPDASQLSRISEMIDRGEISSHLAALFPFEEAAEAHRMLETGHFCGKIVLNVSGSRDVLISDRCGDRG